jgi:hypothetical protein
MIQFTIHYHPTNSSLSLSSNHLTLHQHQCQFPQYTTKYNSKCQVFPTPRHMLQLRMKGLPRPGGTARAGRSALVCTVQLCAGVSTVQGCAREVFWHPDGESGLYGLCRAQTERQRVSVFSEKLCPILRAVELHPEHTVWFNEIPVWKDLRCGGQTK